MQKILGAIVMIISLAACTSNPTATPTASAPSPRTPLATAVALPGNSIGLTADDNGGTVMATLGQTIAIHLSSNSSTGYHWKAMTEPDAKILKLNSNDYFPSSLTPLPGSGGIEIWVYQVVGAGTTSLQLGYFPPGNPSQPANTFSITVQTK